MFSITKTDAPRKAEKKRRMVSAFFLPLTIRSDSARRPDRPACGADSRLWDDGTPSVSLVRSTEGA